MINLCFCLFRERRMKWMSINGDDTQEVFLGLYICLAELSITKVYLV